MTPTEERVEEELKSIRAHLLAMADGAEPRAVLEYHLVVKVVETSGSPYLVETHGRGRVEVG